MNIRDSYIHGKDGKGVVKRLFFATAADVAANSDLHVNDLVFLLADTLETQVPLTIPTLNQNTTGYATSLMTVKSTSANNHYLTFVDSNNPTADAESFYTSGNIYFKPSTGVLTVKSVTVSNTFNYSGIGSDTTTNAARKIWFASSSDGIPVVSDNFKYNPSTKTLTVDKISGPTIVIGNTTLYLDGANNVLTPDTVINNTSTNNTIPSSKAVWDAILAGMKANDAMIFMGFLDGGADLAHTIYTAGADAGYTYKVRTAGYINGEYYQINDTFICTVDGTVAATSSNVNTVKANWGVVEGNGDFLDIHGGTMYGTLSWDGTTALPTVTTASSILVVDSNTTKQITLANLKTALGVANTWRNIYTGGTSRVGTAVNTKAMNFASSSLNITYLAAGTASGQSGNANYFTINFEAKNWSGATSSATGTAGYMPGATSANRLKFLRGNGNWINLPEKAVIANASNSITQLSAAQVNPYYNLIGGGSVISSTRFIAGTGITVGTTDGTDIKFTNSAPIYYIKGNADATEGTWTGTHADIAAYYEGLTIIFVPLIAGASTTTLNINNLGAKTVYFTGTSKCTTHYPVGTPILLTYTGTAWSRADFDSNTTYSKMSISELVTGTATSARSMTAAVLSLWLHTYAHTVTNTWTHSTNNFADGLIIERSGSTNAAAIQFKNSNGSLGYIGMTDTADGGLLRWKGDTSARYLIADASNISNKKATIGSSLTTIATIAGVDITVKIPDVTAQAIQLASVSKTLKVDTWTNMAAVSTYTGTYAIQISSGNVYASGVFTACGGTDSVIDEIPLHVADKGTNTWRPYARISAGQLQMTTNEATGTARTYTIKILKLI